MTPPQMTLSGISNVVLPCKVHGCMASSIQGMTAGYLPNLPTGSELTWPTLKAIEELGGSATVSEIVDKVAEMEALTEEQQSIMRPDGTVSLLYHRLAAARTYLKAAGALIQSKRGVWTIAEQGRQLRKEDLQGITGTYQASLRERRIDGGEPGTVPNEAADKQNNDADSIEDAAASEGEGPWLDRLLSTLLEVRPDQFERLALRLLREAGFINTAVTGKSGDGGIDGVGVYRLSLVSFPVYFQCKRYRDSVGAGVVRDFRGAMTGRGDKGLLIATSSFTADAKREATREGAPPIDLIDGDRLAELLKEHGLGVGTELIERVSIDKGFFESL